MDVWGRFQRRGFGAMADDADKLHQPLMGSDSEDEDRETGALLHPRAVQPQFDDAAARRKRRRRKDDEDLGEVSRHSKLNVDPMNLLRAAGSWLVSLSALGSLVAPKNAAGSSLPVSLSTQMLAHRHKPEDPEKASERALRTMAMLTMGFCVLLLLGVYQQNV